MTRLPNGGRIEVICGCMFSGKTEELIRRLNHVQLARQSLLAFTPRRDTRYRTGSLVSHNGQKIQAITVASIADIVTAVPHGTQVVAIDEGQFPESDPQAIAAAAKPWPTVGFGWWWLGSTKTSAPNHLPSWQS